MLSKRYNPTAWMKADIPKNNPQESFLEDHKRVNGFIVNASFLVLLARQKIPALWSIEVLLLLTTMEHAGQL